MKRLAVFLLAVLVAAGGAFAQAKVYKIKLGHASSTESTRHKSLLVFKDYVEKKSGGRFVVEIYPGAQLGNEGEMIESVKMGSQEAFVGGVFDAQTPKLNLVLMPFFFPTQADLMKVARSDIGKAIMKDAEKYGIKMLAFGDGGSRHFTNNIRPIKSPADMKGLKIRTLPSSPSSSACRPWALTPSPSPTAETYMALKTGVADGQENPLANIGDMKFHRGPEVFDPHRLPVPPRALRRQPGLVQRPASGPPEDPGRGSTGSTRTSRTGSAGR
ncbi:MAG: TRAP transporter substrate-binding protein [Candidatus Moduliflexus flocculans]|nr:TRAP transporter substrate-binding protein [Candidatus Moduliflexus flocculans]